MKKRKSNLDEMQEQKLLKIEHNGCWIAFWGLLIVILAQVAFTPTGQYANLLRILAGEWIVFIALSFYMLFACVKNGIWDRRLHPDRKTNLLCALLAAVAVAVFEFFYMYFHFHKLGPSLAATGVIALVTFALCYATLLVAAKATKKQQEKLEEEPEDETET